MIYTMRTASSAPTDAKLVRIPDDGEEKLYIPGDIDGVPVAALLAGSAGHAQLQAVFIPDSVTDIDADAFTGCPDGLTVCSSVSAAARSWAQDNGYAWVHEPHVLVHQPAVPATDRSDGLTEGCYCTECGEVLQEQQLIPAFGEMDTPDFTLPAFLTSIGDEAFMGISAQVVCIPDSVTAIGSRAFAGCTALRQICIPASVTEFGEGIFDGCSSTLLIYGTAGSPAQGWAVNSHLTFVPME